MIDERDVRLADILVNYSTEVKPGEKVLIEYTGAECISIVRQLIKEVYRAGGKPYVKGNEQTILREILMSCDEEQIRLMDQCDLYVMQAMNVYIGIRGGENISEYSDVPSRQMNLYDSLTTPTLHERVNHTRWVILRYPNASMAQLMNTSREAFEAFYYRVCTLDYSKMNRALDGLKALMEAADQVRIVAPETDVTFSIKGIPAVKCAGEMNLPDGEIYTAPVKNSVNGTISYNVPSEMQGFTYERVRFEFKDGRIIHATCNDNARINALLDTDEGARYIGEFAIGVNPYILHPMKDILFDEKICGSIHLTPGMCYDDASNGNESAVHWDLVLIQREEYGGGELWFDDRLIRKDGLFILPELQGLNPENLK